MNDYLLVLQQVHNLPRTFQCNFARNLAKYVAEAASRGHISCLNAAGRNDGAWRITQEGLTFLKEMQKGADNG